MVTAHERILYKGSRSEQHPVLAELSDMTWRVKVFGGKHTNNTAKFLGEKHLDVSNGHPFVASTQIPNRESRVPSENWRAEEFASKVDCCFRETQAPLLQHVMVCYSIKMNILSSHLLLHYPENRKWKLNWLRNAHRHWYFIPSRNEGNF